MSPQLTAEFEAELKATEAELLQLQERLRLIRTFDLTGTRNVQVFLGRGTNVFLPIQIVLQAAADYEKFLTRKVNGLKRTLAP